MATKYVIIKQGNFELPFVFSDVCNHSEIADFIPGQVISAGFCCVADDKYICFGESISLGLKSRAKDSDVLNRFLTY
jgi:hypothetical protein